MQVSPKLQELKDRARRLIKPDPKDQQKLIEEAREVLSHSSRLTEEEKVSAIEKLEEDIGYKKQKSREKVRPILVKIVVVLDPNNDNEPKNDYIYYEPRDIVSKAVERNQQIIYWCEYPFTIYFGGNSIITDSPLAPVSRIQAWLQSEQKENGLYMIDNAWIWQNALSGKYKYFVAVAVPAETETYKGEHPKVIVDDPEDVVRDPDEDE